MQVIGHQDGKMKAPKTAAMIIQEQIHDSVRNFRSTQLIESARAGADC